jgi:RimJ/RimL family protein N-acetyltransferase/cytidylate kinase
MRGVFMLPEIQLRSISRGDVDRIGHWLESEDISCKWFGQYACGDAIHRGYDPKFMIEAPDSEWDAEFKRSDRFIYSIYTSNDEHVGECQVLRDGEGGAEISLLIGRKELWHLGYGTSTLISLMKKSFEELGLQRMWVNVPSDNVPALGLFAKLGFSVQESRPLCSEHEGESRQVQILSIDALVYYARESGNSKLSFSLDVSSRDYVVTVIGLPGSAADEFGSVLAKRLGYRFVDDEILELTCERLKRTPAEIEGLESTLKSFWARFLDSMVIPMEWSAAYDASHHWYPFDSGVDYGSYEDALTCKKYVKTLSGVVKKFAGDGRVVIAGYGSHVTIRDSIRPLNVFVTGSELHRASRHSDEKGLGLNWKEAAKMLSRADKEAQDVFRRMFGCDMLDMSKYDLILNLDLVSFNEASDGIAAMIEGFKDTSLSDSYELSVTSNS